MKLGPDQQAILDRMAPAALCQEGFLGADTRSLAEIICTDQAAVEAMGTTGEDLAQRLGAIVTAAMAAQGRTIQVHPHLAATYHEVMGRIPSPWPGEGVFAKGHAELLDQRTGLKADISPLSVHMIAAHGFFQGRGSRYRIEPNQIIRMLRPDE